MYDFVCGGFMEKCSLRYATTGNIMNIISTILVVIDIAFSAKMHIIRTYDIIY